MKIEKRVEHLNTLRKMKKLPGVMYGKTIEPISIQVDEKDFRDFYKTHGKTKAFKVKLDKETHQVFIKDMQKDPLNPKAILCFDFLKVEHGNFIRNKVPLRVHGREDVEKIYGIVQVASTEVEVEYSVDKGIDAIDIDVSQMQIGESIHVRDLKLPAGIKATDDESRLLINILEAKRVTLETEAAAEASEAQNEMDEQDSEAQKTAE